MNPEREKWLLLIVLTVIWGSSFILIKKSLEHYGPFQVGALRVLIAGLLLAPVALLNMAKFPKKRWKWLVLAAVTGNFVPMFLFPLAETEVSSSIAGIINSMMPIFVIIIGALFWKFQTTKRQVIGVAISFSGACLLMVSGREGGSMKIVPILWLLLATLLYAVSTTTVKSKLSDIPAKIMSAFVFFFILAVPSLITLAFTGFFHNFEGTKSEFIGLGYVSLLSVFGTGLAMMLNYRLLNISTPLFASTVTLLMPIVAVIWGVLDGETLTLIQFAGGIIIIMGLIFLRSRTKIKKLL
jgi:drug/metabolite transporter (DMT)-like permease